ncbi:MAG: putative ATP-dependent RNA helicase [Methanomassiliicoccales archaeon PtaU1.Bin124]|nr:MAG: putative ATP-dependent RNA helicase [Methanomassiliicoccales archaeon PtaU1.Bin124]
MSVGFDSFDLDPLIMKAIERMGWNEPTPVQEKTIPVLLEGKDVMGQAQTGTGKTAAFGIPILQNVSRGRKPYALILVPTRELGVQVADEMKKLAYYYQDVRILPVYGGRSIDEQIEFFKKGIDIVVGTPGRIIDHIHRRTLDLSEVEYLVLDEADRMLDMGFIEDIEFILEQVPKKRQTMLFSATLPEGVRGIAEKHMKDPLRITVSEQELVLPTTKQIYFNIERKNKIWALCRVLDKYKPKAIIFAQTKMMVDIICKRLQSYGYPVAALHGDITQAKREKVLTDFRSGKIKVLVATDVAARGLDIQGVTHVINYDIPEDPEVYVHRIGRTGRAGKEGIAITFITAAEMYLLKKIKEYGVIDVVQEEVPETGRRDVVRRVTDFTDVADIFGMVRMKIDVGEKDGLRKIDLLDVLENQIHINDMDIGSVLIEPEETVFEVQKNAAAKVVQGIKKVQVRGKKANLEIVPVQKSSV